MTITNPFPSYSIEFDDDEYQTFSEAAHALYNLIADMRIAKCNVLKSGTLNDPDCYSIEQITDLWHLLCSLGDCCEMGRKED